MLSLDQFHFNLPPERIAHTPVEPRDHSRLLAVNRNTGECKNYHYYDLPLLLRPGDVLVRNNTKVIPARIFGQKDTGGKAEILLVRNISNTPITTTWECLVKPGIKLQQRLSFSELSATCVGVNEFTRNLEFSLPLQDFFTQLDRLGHTPIPPYIQWQDQDEAKLRDVYQTTFAAIQGSVAAPTAGLHFTSQLDQRLREKGVEIHELTLHVGLGTFLPVQSSQIEAKKLHQEIFDLPAETARAIMAAKAEGRRIIAVGTTTTRTLETCSALDHTQLRARSGTTELFIQPGFCFTIVDAMLTNFHLSESSLLMLVSAFASEPNTTHPFDNFNSSVIGKAYEYAINHNYRFFSFGDGMFIF